MSFYHVFNRGIDKRDIFRDKNDYVRYLTLMYLFNTEEDVGSIDVLVRSGVKFTKLLDVKRGPDLVQIVQYCLMPNHFHFLIWADDQRDIGKFLQRVNTGYAMHFNLKYDKSGSVWQGKPKKKRVGTDAYLRTLFAYIACNPLELFDSQAHTDAKVARQLVGKIGEYSMHSLGASFQAKRFSNKIVNSAILRKVREVAPGSFTDIVEFFVTSHPSFRS